MKTLIIASCILALANTASFGLAGVPGPIVKTQYHTQNVLGEATYGHAEPSQIHNAVQDTNGNKLGSYSYVAPNGQIISVSYVADALGYRVISNNLPVAPSVIRDVPEVAAARAAHFLKHEGETLRKRRAAQGGAFPIVRGATLTTIFNNPGYAVSYRVD